VDNEAACGATGASAVHDTSAAPGEAASSEAPRPGVSSSWSEEEELPSDVRVLVVDDLPVNCTLLRRALRFCSRSWHVETRNDAESALETFCEAATPFDLVIMDEHLSLHGMTGSKAIECLRAWEEPRVASGRRRRAAVISCSGSNAIAATDAFAEFVLSMGADATWAKPFPDFTNGEMQRQLRTLLRHRPLQLEYQVHM